MSNLPSLLMNKESHQEAYYRELRLDRLTRMYLDGMHTFRGFEYSSVGIELAKKMSELSPLPPKL